MFLGIEIGGTKLQLGLGESDGRLAGLWRGSVVPNDGAAGIRTQITQAVPELLRQAGIERHQVKAAGVGFGGPVDDQSRCVIKSHQIAGWDQFPLADWIAEVVQMPTALGNDADVAGLGEALYGAGRGLSPIFYVTIGSGIGGGLIINGKIYRGVGNGAAEIGHLRLDGALPGEPIHTDILEHFASGWALARQANKLAAQGKIHDPELLQATPNLTGQLVVDAARRGDPGARAVLDLALSQLARALTFVIALLCPRRIVIGGGVALIGEEMLFAPLRRLVAEQAFRPFADCYDIVPAALGEEMVLHGAIALASQLEQH